MGSARQTIIAMKITISSGQGGCLSYLMGTLMLLFPAAQERHDANWSCSLSPFGEEALPSSRFSSSA